MRCTTCDGEGHYEDEYGTEVNCPDCVKGRQRIEQEENEED